MTYRPKYRNIFQSFVFYIYYKFHYYIFFFMNSFQERFVLLFCIFPSINFFFSHLYPFQEGKKIILSICQSSFGFILNRIFTQLHISNPFLSSQITINIFLACYLNIFPLHSQVKYLLLLLLSDFSSFTFQMSLP